MNRLAPILLCVSLLFPSRATYAGVTPHNIAVIVNENSTESEAVGRYYCSKAGIPLSNLIEIDT